MKLLKGKTYQKLQNEIFDLRAQVGKLKHQNAALERKVKATPQTCDEVPAESYDHVYTGVDGTRYFVCDVEKLHRSRQVMLMGTLNQMALGLDLETLQTLMSQAMQAARNGDFEQSIRHMSNISTRASNLGTPRLLYRAALICVMIEGEPRAYSADFMKRKEQLFEADADARFFFMHWALTTIKGYSNISQEDFQKWAAQKEAEITENQI